MNTLAGYATAQAFTTLYAELDLTVDSQGPVTPPATYSASLVQLGDCSAKHTLSAVLGWGIDDAQVMLAVAAKSDISWLGWSVSSALTLHKARNIMHALRLLLESSLLSLMPLFSC